MYRIFEGGYRHVPREKQLENLEKLRARKMGQLRAYQQAMFLIGREANKEERELEIIEEDMASLKAGN